MAQIKEQIKAPEKIQLSNEETANLSVAEFKTLVIRMLTEMIEYGRKIKEEMKVYTKWNKAKYTGKQQWGEGNWDSNQHFGTKGRNKPIQNRMKKQEFKKRGEYVKPLAQVKMFQHSNHKDAIRRRRRARNQKLIWTYNEGKLPQSPKELDMQVQEDQRVPK